MSFTHPSGHSQFTLCLFVRSHHDTQRTLRRKSKMIAKKDDDANDFMFKLAFEGVESKRKETVVGMFQKAGKDRQAGLILCQREIRGWLERRRAKAATAAATAGLQETTETSDEVTVDDAAADAVDAFVAEELARTESDLKTATADQEVAAAAEAKARADAEAAKAVEVLALQDARVAEDAAQKEADIAVGIQDALSTALDMEQPAVKPNAQRLSAGHASIDRDSDADKSADAGSSDTTPSEGNITVTPDVGKHSYKVAVTTLQKRAAEVTSATRETFRVQRESIFAQAEATAEAADAADADAEEKTKHFDAAMKKSEVATNQAENARRTLEKSSKATKLDAEAQKAEAAATAAAGSDDPEERALLLRQAAQARARAEAAKAIAEDNSMTEEQAMESGTEASADADLTEAATRAADEVKAARALVADANEQRALSRMMAASAALARQVSHTPWL